MAPLPRIIRQDKIIKLGTLICPQCKGELHEKHWWPLMDFSDPKQPKEVKADTGETLYFHQAETCGKAKPFLWFELTAAEKKREKEMNRWWAERTASTKGEASVSVPNKIKFKGAVYVIAAKSKGVAFDATTSIAIREQAERELASILRRAGVKPWKVKRQNEWRFGQGLTMDVKVGNKVVKASPNVSVSLNYYPGKNVTEKEINNAVLCQVRLYTWAESAKSKYPKIDDATAQAFFSKLGIKVHPLPPEGFSEWARDMVKQYGTYWGALDLPKTRQMLRQAYDNALHHGPSAGPAPAGGSGIPGLGF